jgi:hypothetical protein
MTPRLLLLLLMLACVLAQPARAHDSWFEPVAPGVGRIGARPMSTDPAQLLLGTGERYPRQQTAVAPAYFEKQGCRPADASGGERAMRPAGYAGAHALRLTLPAAAASCWAQLVPLDVELTPDRVAVYLREIRAPAAVWAAWQAQRQQGLPWRERYVKHLRIDLAARPQGSAPVPLEMDLVQQPGGHLQVLRDGQPLAEQAVELLGDRLPMGIWRRSGADGRLDLDGLPPGRWLARAVDLRPEPATAGYWSSRFVTLAFVIGGPGR